MATLVWMINSPAGVVHTVRGEAGLRLLCQEEKLPYDKLAKHVHYKEVKLPEKRQKHVKGWRWLSDAHFLQRGESVVCVVGADAKEFIVLVNTTPSHPMCGDFDVADHERLTHLLNNSWVWSNSVKVNHMHGWELLGEPPATPEKFLLQVPLPSPFAPDPDEVRTPANCAYHTIPYHTIPYHTIP
jgi:hypothetical protein